MYIYVCVYVYIYTYIRKYICICIYIHMYMHIYKVPPSYLHTESSPLEASPLPISASLNSKEGETIYDYQWYPYMNSLNPSTCVYASTSRDNPIHLWDAYTGQIRTTYRGKRYDGYLHNTHIYVYIFIIYIYIFYIYIYSYIYICNNNNTYLTFFTYHSKSKKPSII